MPGITGGYYSALKSLFEGILLKFSALKNPCHYGVGILEKLLCEKRLIPVPAAHEYKNVLYQGGN
jgi:hypothetical protein